MRALPRDLYAAAACPMVWTACCDRLERSQSKKTMNDVGAATGGGGGGGGGGSEEQAATSSVVARTTSSFLSMICSLKAEASEGRSSLSDRAPARAFGRKRHNPARVPAPCRMSGQAGFCSACSGSELVELGYIVPEDTLLHLGAEMRCLLGDHVLAVRPG